LEDESSKAVSLAKISSVPSQSQFNITALANEADESKPEFSNLGIGETEVVVKVPGNHILNGLKSFLMRKMATMTNKESVAF